MKSFAFRMPTRVVFGTGVLETIGEEALKLGQEKAFIVTGRTATKTSPFLPIMIQSLEVKGFAVKIYSDIEADPSIETVDTGASLMREWGADLVIAMGGGSPMDAAKSMAMLQGNEGSIKEYIFGEKKVAQPGLPVICIPTTAGTGSEVTAAAVTTDRITQQKIGLSHDYMMPKLALVDPRLHGSMPPRVTASTGMDALTHAIEAFVATGAEPITDALCLEAIRLIGKYLRRAVAVGDDLEVRGQMALASLIAGGGFTNAGLGAVHGLAHPVGARYGVAHGLANAILLPYVMEYCLMADYEKFSRIAEALGEEVTGLSVREKALAAVKAVRALNDDIGIPRTLQEVGVQPEAIEAIAQDGATYRLLPNSPRRLDKNDLLLILTSAFG